MITAFFDDSGTHPTSDIVVVAGVFSTEARLGCFERDWKRELAHPIEGMRPPIKRFHMTHCQNSQEEFSGWKRPETDYLCSRLRRLFVEHEITGYGVACSRRDWEELVTGDYAAIFGTAEGFCIRNCFVRSLTWAQRRTFDTRMKFVFDDRPSSVKRDAGVVYDAFDKGTEGMELAGIAFESSFDTVLIQAADLVAWELYQHAKDVLADGDNFAPRRIEFARLVQQTRFEGQIATRDEIQHARDKLWNKRNPQHIKQIAEHFRSFDPKNQTYINLSTVPEE